MSFARLLVRGIHLSSRRHALSKFTMPAMSPTMTEGGISSWKKKEGDSYSTGDVLLEIETDKATIDVEAQDDGILAKIISGDGAKNITVGATIAIIAEPGDDISGAEALAKDSSMPQPNQEEKPQAKDAPPAANISEPGPPSPPVSPSELQVQSPKSLTGDILKGGRIFASPIAKKIALERGIPLAELKGSGPEGRIIRNDVESYKPSTSALSGTTATITSPGPSLDPPYTEIPVSNMRRTIGQRLTKSKQEVPHYYVTVEIDMERLLKLREVFNQKLEKSDKLSVNDFVVKACALALRDVPEANAAWMGETIRQYSRADISVAVATPTGLITPIIRDATNKGLATISVETKALAKKARDGKLKGEEYQGGTFTISNMGMFGVDHFTAIVNPPQACILAVSSTVPTLVPVGPDAAPEDVARGFKTAHIMKVTLSADHRVVDGALGARWLGILKGYLENPLTFML
ncbi:pyruvate dehydrogenase [Hysterangium stoloniferum]|nr:pyruvate dehydrogenase [Hysterangium stoloniferum]